MCNCIIGIWSEYEQYELISYEQLKKKVKQYNERCDLLNNYWETNQYKKHDLKYFLDKRTNTPLLRFNNCCWCGKRINWKELKEKDK